MGRGIVGPSLFALSFAVCGSASAMVNYQVAQAGHCAIGANIAGSGYSYYGGFYACGATAFDGGTYQSDGRICAPSQGTLMWELDYGTSRADVGTYFSGWVYGWLGAGAASSGGTINSWLVSRNQDGSQAAVVPLSSPITSAGNSQRNYTSSILLPTAGTVRQIVYLYAGSQAGSSACLITGAAG